MSNKQWRPEGWKPYSKDEPAYEGEWNDRPELCNIAYEVGADAILTALKADVEAEHCNAGDWIETVAGEFNEAEGVYGIAGTWVFIPDTEEIVGETSENTN